MDADQAAYVLRHRHDLPESEVDKAERWLAHNNRHAARLETGHFDEEKRA